MTTDTAASSTLPRFTAKSPSDLQAAGYLWTEEIVARMFGIGPDAMSALVSHHFAELHAYGDLEVGGERETALPSVVVPVYAFNVGHLLLLCMVTAGPRPERARMALVQALAAGPRDTLQERLMAALLPDAAA